MPNLFSAPIELNSPNSAKRKFKDIRSLKTWAGLEKEFWDELEKIVNRQRVGHNVPDLSDWVHRVNRIISYCEKFEQAENDEN